MPQPITFRLEAFQRIAERGWFDHDLFVEDRDTLGSQFRHLKSTNAEHKEINKEVMDVFQRALEEKYGQFGTIAFNEVLGTRAQKCQSLRKSDVRKAIANAAARKDLSRRGLATVMESTLRSLLASHPFLRQLSADDRDILRIRVLDLLDGWNSDFDQMVNDIETKPGALEALVEEKIWDTIDSYHAFGRKVPVAIEPAPEEILAPTGTDEHWSVADDHALMLNLNDPATQARLTQAIAETVEAARASGSETAMVQMWDLSRENGEWKSPEAFLSFCCAYADRLPCGLTVAAHVAMETALRDPNSLMARKLYHRLPEYSHHFLDSHIRMDNRRELETSDRAKLQARRDVLTSELELHLQRFNHLLTEAKVWVNLCQAKSDQAIAELNAKGKAEPEKLEALAAEAKTRADALTAAQARYDSLAQDVKAFETWADKELRYACRNYSSLSPDIEKPLETFATASAQLATTFHDEVHFDPAECSEQDRAALLKAQLDTEKAELTHALAKANESHEKGLYDIANLRLRAGVYNHHVNPQQNDDPTAEVPDFDAQNDVLARSNTESINALLALREPLEGRIREEATQVANITTSLKALKPKSEREADLREALEAAKALKDQLRAHSVQAESLEAQTVLTPESLMSNPATLRNAKLRGIMLLRQAVVDLAHQSDNSTAIGRVLARFRV